MRLIPIPTRVTLRAATLLAASACAAAILAPFGSSAATMPNVCPADAAASLSRPLYVTKPPIAEATGVHGTALIRLDLSPQGRLVSAKVVTSTQNRWLDHAALDAVREARFAPELRDCKNVGGSYLVEVDFPED